MYKINQIDNDFQTYSVFNFYLHLSIIDKSWNSNYNFEHIFFHLFQVILYVIRDIHIYNNRLLWIYHFGIKYIIFISGNISCLEFYGLFY